MRSLRGCLIIFIITSAAFVRAHAERLFFGEVPVQYVAQCDEITLDLHRFLHPPTATIKVASGDATFDASAFTLRIRANDEGLKYLKVSAELGKEKIVRFIVIASRAQPKTGVTFKPPSHAEKVTIAGPFNSWSKDATLMTGPDDSGAYQIELSLPPGRHAYKFAVDGQWMLDPNNSATEDDGTGGKNSVLLVQETEREPTIYADRRAGQNLILRAINEAGSIGNVIAVGESNSGDILISARLGDNDEITVPIPAGVQSLRIVASTRGGKPSNVVIYSLKKESKFDWHDALLYYALTDRFADGDKSNDKPIDDAHVAPPANYHGGDLRGIRQEIEDGYFSSLGVNALWIAPLNKNPAHACQESPEPHRWYTGYHGYWPISPTEIDPHFGNGEELRKLIDTAHVHGIKVIADLVLHHVHEEHPWWKAHRDWFGQLELPDGRKNLRLWDEQQFTTWFEPYLPSFDFSKDAPVHALIDNTVWWAKHYQLDGFRLDAVKHILPSFWWKFRSALREQVESKRGTQLYLVGETFKDRAGIDSFVGPNMLDGQFDFPLYDSIKDTLGTATASLISLDDAINTSERAYGKGTLMSPLIGNHDKGRFMAYADGELPDPAIKKEEEVGWQKPPSVHDNASYSKLELAQALLLALDGVPMIYYGDEIGMTGAGDPDNRRDMRFGDKVTGAEQSVLNHFRKLAEVRQWHPALRYGSRRTIVRENDCLVFVRAYLDDRILVALNHSQAGRELGFDLPPELIGRKLIDLRNGERVSHIEGKLSFTIPPMSAVFLSAAAK